MFIGRTDAETEIETLKNVVVRWRGAGMKKKKHLKMAGGEGGERG